MEFQCGRPSEAWTDTYVMNWSQSEPLFSVPPAKFNAWIAQLVAQQHFDSSTEDLMYLEVRGARPIVANGADLEAIFLAYTTIGYPLYFTIINKGDPDPYPGI